MEATKKQLRPFVVHAQEICCSLEEWKATLGRISTLGYTAYASSTVLRGAKCNGVLTMVSNHVQSQMCDEYCNKRGYAAIALKVQDLLMINSYCPPTVSELHQHAIEFEEMLIRLDWQGPMLFCGDWNQEPSDCLVATLAVMFGCSIADSDENSSRWQGHRLIDFFISDIPHLRFRALDAKISDHKIMETTVKLECCSYNVHRFKKGFNFEKPLWLNTKGWEDLVHQAYNIEKATNWQHACKLTDADTSIPSQVDDSDQDQEIVDFTWKLTMSKALTTFQTAYKLAILSIPENFDNKWEIKRIEKLVNKVQSSRLSVEKFSWDQHSPQFRTSMARRRLRNKLNLAQELAILLQKGKHSHVSFSMMRKLYGRDFMDFDTITLPKVCDDIQEWEKQILKLENEDKEIAFRRWRRRIVSDTTYRANWIKKKISYYPQVQHRDRTSTSKPTAVDLIREFDMNLKRRVWMNEDQRRQRVREIAHHLHNFQGNVQGSAPNLKDLQQAISKAKGGPGLDQWNYYEIKTLAKIPEFLREIGQNFKLWIDLGITPSILAEVKVTYIPKANKISKGTVNIKGLRPITVFSIWWRTFSAMWIMSPLIDALQTQMPKDIICRRSKGPEVQACVADALLQLWQHGATLDFSHCFDTVDIKMLRDGVRIGIPILSPWITVVCDHWLKCHKWIHYDKHVGDTLENQTGIPQGDPASPLALSLLLWVGHARVQEHHQPGRLHQCIWMDDRTMICNNKQLLRDSMERWGRFAEDFHLLENETKTQTVAPDEAKAMEVLGALTGQPNRRTFNKVSPNKERFEKAIHVSRRVGLLPNKKIRMNDLATLARPTMSYGWIAGRPSKGICSEYNTQLWKTLGNITFSPPSLRRLISGAHLEADPVLWLKQVRLLSNRNAELTRLGHCLDLFETALSRNVLEGFEKHGWTKCRGTWRHEHCGHFLERDISHLKEWKKIAHKLRDSVRWSAWEEFKVSGRHEIAGLQLPQMTIERINMTREWASTKP